MAVLWVFCVHNNLFCFQFYTCLFPFQNTWIWTVFGNGDMGVDIFFVLSGFLITFVLNREYKKYGDIDWWHFMRMRFLRLYPGYGTFIGIAFFFLLLSGTDAISIANFVLPPLFFVANLVGGKIHKTHLWSVCVEMQFYLFSPYLVKTMFKSDKPWITPAVLCIVSTILNLVIPSIFCPQGWTDVLSWYENDPTTGEKLPVNCSNIMYTGVYE